MVKMIETPDGDYFKQEDCTVTTGYELRGRLYDDVDTLTAKLRTEYRDYLEELGVKIGADEVADNEGFNNWTDGLCKGGEICEDTYREMGAFHD